MSSERSAALGSGVELLERALSYTVATLRLVTVEALADPSPCHEWDLLALLNHLDDSLAAISEAVEVGRIHMPGSPSRMQGSPGSGRRSSNGYQYSGAEPVARLRERAGRMLGAWMNAAQIDVVPIADRELTPGIVTRTGALEIAVHGWDIARTCGYARPIPPGLAIELLQVASVVVTDADRPVRFARPCDPDPEADPGSRLLAFLGRGSA